jgi:hypothetical protein
MYLLAVVVGLLGLVFLAGNQGEVLRIVVGGVLIAAAIAMVVAARMRPKVIQRNVVQKIDIGGDVRLEDLKCRKCGATLSKEAVTVQDGAVMVACPYCQAAYQMEEEPKW